MHVAAAQVRMWSHAHAQACSQFTTAPLARHLNRAVAARSCLCALALGQRVRISWPPTCATTIHMLLISLRTHLLRCKTRVAGACTLL